MDFLTYHKSADFVFYEELLRKEGINLHTIEDNNSLRRFLKLRSFIRNGNYRAVLSFLETPSLTAELASIPFRRWKLIVGERSSNPTILNTIKGRLLRWGHLLADNVVSNSESNRQLIKKACPLLSDKVTKVIYNGYDLTALHPNLYNYVPRRDGRLHIIVAARHQVLKNLLGLVKAILLLNNEERNKLAINWYGAKTHEWEMPEYVESRRLIDQEQLSDTISFFPPTSDIYKAMASADAIGLFSVYEGLPNTVCEGMCLGKPVIATDVSDNLLLLENKELVPSPNSPKEIANSLRYLMSMSNEELQAIGRKNRQKAETLFNIEKIVEDYFQLLL